VLLGALLVTPLGGLSGGCNKDKDGASKGAEDEIQRQGGIPVIPRGEVKLSAARGERYLLEIEAPVMAKQAVAFYRSRLPRERWTDLQIQRVSEGLWGLRAKRGMFQLTGRIKALDASRTSIGFERKVLRKADQRWTPPVPPEVVVLADRIRWQERVYDAGGSRVEIRGTSADEPAALRKRIRSALTDKGWSLPETETADTIVATRPAPARPRPRPARPARPAKPGEDKGDEGDEGDKKEKDGEPEPRRRLRYTVEAHPSGAQVRLQLALEELTGGSGRAGRPSPGRPARPRADGAGDRAGDEAPDARRPASTDLVPVPAELKLWSDKPPPVARRLSKELLSVSFERPCATGKGLDDLRQEVIGRLRKKGFRIMSGPRLSGAAGAALSGDGNQPRAITANRQKSMVVAMISREPAGTCLVTLTMTRR
jgi:hypothetical protein